MGDPRGEVAMGGEEGGGVEWRQVLRNLEAGQIVEIGVDDADESKKRRQLTRRAERRGMAVEITVGGGVLRARKTGEVVVDETAAAEERERRERRRAARAEGAAE